jgi:Na+/melibiose symporter-like transporter
MSVAVSIKKYTFGKKIYQKCNLHLYAGCVCCLLEIISWITKVLFVKETSKLPILTRREQERTKGYSDVKSEKFQQKMLLFRKKQFICFILSLLICFR